jgi:hypothetical protein
MCECFWIPLHPKVLNVYVVDYGKLIKREHSQEENFGFSLPKSTMVLVKLNKVN